jgi:protoporphyrinogen oxidase
MLGRRLAPLSTPETSIGTAVIGGGPAGLSAAYVLALRGAPGAVFEAHDAVGGIARTVERDGNRFDLGGHRFFTKLKPVERLWENLLGTELLVRPRLSRIYYDGRYLAYPLQVRDVVARLGIRESSLCALSYLTSRRGSEQDAQTFEDWVTLRFGRRLYDTFFRSYTEKVWGIPGSEIRAEWAAQRIKNFSLAKAMLRLAGFRNGDATTLIEEFRYPRLGPGQMWQALADRVEAGGIPVHLGHACLVIRRSGTTVESIGVWANGRELELRVDGILSSMPLVELVAALDPPAPPAVLAAAGRLRYRSLCLVALVTTGPNPFPDNWIYLHDPGTRAGRVQNFRSWSEDMVSSGTNCLGVEYFCFEGDEIWEASEEQAVEMAADELAEIGLVDRSRVTDGVKVNVPKAYPMYDGSYREAVATIRGYLDRFTNLKTFGRNGLHRYNNQDHSMWTGILAALNLLDGSAYDVWSVNTEAEYLEEGAAVDALLDIDLLGSSGGIPDQLRQAEPVDPPELMVERLFHQVEEHDARSGPAGRSPQAKGG